MGKDNGKTMEPVATIELDNNEGTGTICIEEMDNVWEVRIFDENNEMINPEIGSFESRQECLSAIFYYWINPDWEFEWIK